MEDNRFALLGAFGAGMLIGGGMALLCAPQRGKDLRRRLQTSAVRAKDDLTERGKEAWSATAGRGQEYMTGGKEAMKNFIGNTRDHIEKTMEAFQEVERKADDTLRGGEHKDTSQKAS